MSKLRPILIVLTLGAFGLPSFAQRIEIPPTKTDHVVTEPEPARDLEYDTWVPYTELSYIFSEIEGDSANLARGEIGFTMNNRFSIGIVGTVLLTDVNLKGYEDKDLIGENELWWAGMQAEYRIPSTTYAHWSFGISCQLAVGEVEAFIVELDDDDSADFVALEPGVDFLYRIYDYVELGVGFSYIWATDVESKSISDDDISVWMGSVNLRLREFW